jgi:hypothetical protein
MEEKKQPDFTSSFTITIVRHFLLPLGIIIIIIVHHHHHSPLSSTSLIFSDSDNHKQIEDFLRFSHHRDCF